MQQKLKVFTWHIHGSYLFYLSQGNYEIFIPVNSQKTEGYYGRGATYPFGPNVHEVAEDEVRQMEFDLILFQTDENYFADQFKTLSEEQRMLPKIYLEHDPPWGHPTDSLHPVNDPDIIVVHVTHFNRLMWDNHGFKTVVIEHGVVAPEIPENLPPLDKGIVLINNLPTRGRLLGLDIFKEVRKHIPLDLVGMGAEEYGIGEVLHPQLPSFVSRYRFCFNPIRYTSLGLAVCENMMLGLPIIGLATTEMSVTIQNGFNGYIHTDVQFLIEKMQFLLDHPEKAREMGGNARKTALDRFGIKRFVTQWEELFLQVSQKSTFK